VGAPCSSDRGPLDHILLVAILGPSCTGVGERPVGLPHRAVPVLLVCAVRVRYAHRGRHYGVRGSSTAQ
jgi:hypothetical protein